MPNFLTIAARIVSICLHPLFVPLYAYIITLSTTGHYRLQIPAHAQSLIAAMIFMITAVVPSIIFYIMLKMRFVSSLQMPFRQERHVPILITALSFYISYQLLNSFGVAPLFGFYMLAASMLSLIALGINLWLKVSLHMVALGALAGSMAVFSRLFGEQYLIIALLTILASGLTGAARLVLGAHRQVEIYLGFLTGFTWMYVLFALIR